MKYPVKKYHFIDSIRGFAIINMVLFHFFYDYYMIYKNNISWYSATSTHIWQQFICYTFIIIAGISFHFSSNNLKRGFIINGYGLLITAITFIFFPNEGIFFGILNLIGCSILLMHLLKKYLARISPILGIFLFFILFYIFRNADSGYLQFFILGRLQLPGLLYSIKPLTLLGFPYVGFQSSDYFPILPWFFLFLVGYYLWPLILKKENISKKFFFDIPLLSKIGKKSLIVYFLHQPIAFALCAILDFLA